MHDTTQNLMDLGNTFHPATIVFSWSWSSSRRPSSSSALCKYSLISRSKSRGNNSDQNGMACEAGIVVADFAQCLREVNSCLGQTTCHGVDSVEVYLAIGMPTTATVLTLKKNQLSGSKAKSSPPMPATRYHKAPYYNHTDIMHGQNDSQ